MIYVGTATMMIPTEGTEMFLSALRQAMCAGCPAGTGVGTPAASAPLFANVAIGLVTNAVDPGCGLVFADLVLTDNPGGAPIYLNQEAPPNYCLEALEGPAEGLDGYWRLVIDQQIWTAATPGATPPQVTGVALYDEAMSKLIAYGPLPGGPASFDENDIVKIACDLPLRCQVLLPPA